MSAASYFLAGVSAGMAIVALAWAADVARRFRELSEDSGQLPLRRDRYGSVRPYAPPDRAPDWMPGVDPMPKRPQR